MNLDQVIPCDALFKNNSAGVDDQRYSFSTTVDGSRVSYKYNKPLGRGSFGVAELYESTRTVVIKKVCLGAILAKCKNPKAVKLNEQEPKLLESLNHPNVVKIFHAWQDKEFQTVFMELEYCAGGTLSDVISSNKTSGKDFSLKQYQKLFAQIALGVAYLHDFGIVHRDLNPKNILLSGDFSTPKIADFGLAKHLDGDDSTIGWAGTPNYMAPELIRYIATGEGEELKSRPNVDIWALGVIAYQMATGEVPYRSPGETGNYVAFGELNKLYSNERLRPENMEQVDQKFPGLEALITRKLLVTEVKLRASMVQVLEDPFVESTAAEYQRNVNAFVHDQLRRLTIEKSNLEALCEGKDVRIAELNRAVEAQFWSSRSNEVELKIKTEESATLNEKLQAAQRLNTTLAENIGHLEAKIEKLEKDLIEQRAESDSRINDLEMQMKSLSPAASRRLVPRSSSSMAALASAFTSDTAKQSKLFQACLDGDVYLIRKYLTTLGGDPNSLKYLPSKHKKIGNQLWPDGTSCLHFAAASNKPEAVSALLEEFDADPNLPDCRNQIALNLAINSGHLEVIRTFCSDCAVVDQKFIAKDFFEACYSGKVELIKAMLMGNQHFDINCKYDVEEHGKIDGCLWPSLSNGLHFASFRGRIEVAKLLLMTPFGANVNLKNAEGHNAVDTGRKYGNHKFVGTLCELGTWQDVTSIEVSLFEACLNGSIELAKACLKTNAKMLGSYDELKHGEVGGRIRVNGNNCFHFAAMNGHPAILKLLLENAKFKGQVNAQNEEGWTALNLASFNGHLTFVKMLLEGNADLEVKTRDGKTALMNAVMKHHFDVAAYLASCGADVNCHDIRGRSALGLALSEEMRDLLISYGAVGQPTIATDSDSTGIQMYTAK